METPKLFISYSWTSTDHEKWVLDLATELRENKVDVILDKWDLKEGHDTIAFMEKMVTDDDIKKVLIISDRMYADKADGRDGGVGTETLIISKDIYDNQEQTKFVAAITEKDNQGKAYLPTYYRSRKYIDFTEEDYYQESFDKLLRWIYDKELFVKPELGNQPDFVTSEDTISLGTSHLYKKTLDAIKNDKKNVSGLLDEYFETFSSNLEKFRIVKDDVDYDDKVITNIEDFLPYRDEYIKILVSISRYGYMEENIIKIHKFLENLIPYMENPENIRSYNEWDYDNFIFIIHELFLYTIALLLKFERFETVNQILGKLYFNPSNAKHGLKPLEPFTTFRRHMRTLDHNNAKNKLQRASLRADMLLNRCEKSPISFQELMQADFVIFLREQISQPNHHWRWWPETLLHSSRQYSPFEIFVRSQSEDYFNKSKIILGIKELKDLDLFLDDIKQRKRDLPSWSYYSLNIVALIGRDGLATLP